MDPGQCRFGKWLEAEVQAGRSDDPACRLVGSDHEKFHDLAQQILQSQLNGRSAGGFACLTELHSICDRFLEDLETIGTEA
jgi:hypothetical protein